MSNNGVEDAPLDHAAWKAVKKCAPEILYFELFRDEEKLRIQMTFKAAGGSREECARILRLCYLRAEEGASKEEIQVYKKSFAVGEDSAPSVAPAGDGVGASPPDGSQTEKETVSFPKAAPVASNITPQPNIDDDAPEGHPAWRAVKTMTLNGKKLAVVFYKPKEQGAEAIRMQVTEQAAGGDVSQANRICRLCYMKLADGCSKQDVEVFKKQICDSFRKPSEAKAKSDSNGVKKGFAKRGFASKRAMSKKSGSNSWRKLRRVRNLEAMSDDQLQHVAKHIAKQMLRRDTDALALWCRIGLSAHEKLKEGS